MEILAEYTNGNTDVKIFSDGTKIRSYENTPKIVHPESIDIKITDYCDMGCLYCHESSTVSGKHGDLEELLSVLSALPKGVELAIGGGNPLSHPGLIDFLKALKKRGLIANITVNQGHLKRYQSLLFDLIDERLVFGVGISVTSNNFKNVYPLRERTENIVYHVIAGVNDISVLDKLIELGVCKVLVLGYKDFGFGVSYRTPAVESSIEKWRKTLPKYIGKCVLSFDNLAIEQLAVKRLFTTEGWERFYMGDDFCFTMYIDAVNQEYAPTSRSSVRTSFKETTLLEYFNQ